MREIDHHADAIHLGNDFPAEHAESVVRRILRRLTGVRVGKLVVAGVREPHIPRPSLEELAYARQVGADGISVLDPDHRDRAPGLRDAGHVGGRQRQLDLFRRNLLRQPVHRIKLRHRLAIGVRVARRRQRPLRHLHDEEGHVEASVSHLRQVRLRHKTTGVVAGGGEMGGLEIDVRVDRQHSLVDRTRPGHKRGICRR